MIENPLFHLLILAVPAALARLWWTGSKARELAINHAKQACQRQQVQLLDQTVVMSRQRPARNAKGSSCFRRDYQFEFTGEGQFRDSATVTMLGHTLQSVYFPYTRDNEGNRIYTH